MKEAIWNWFAFWGPVFRDVLSVGLAGLGSYLAWLAIQMGKGQQKLSEELAAIEKRQAQIAEEQHKWHVAEVSKKPDVVIQLEKFELADGFFCFLKLANAGNATAHSVDFIVTFKINPQMLGISFPLPLEADADLPEGIHMVGGTHAKPLYMGNSVNLMHFSLPKDYEKGSVQFAVYAQWEGGRFPDKGTKFIGA